VRLKPHCLCACAYCAAAMTTLSEEQFLQMQENERYSQWHPRLVWTYEQILPL
jgi:hypothetical protein